MSLPKYLQDKETVKDISLKQEKRVQRQLASGALWNNKGDLKSEDCLFELKIGKKQVTITKEILEKIFTEASKDGKQPVLLIEIDEYIFIGEVIKK
jgi:hypothetical protein